MNERVAGLGATLFVFGALMNLSSVGEAAIGNLAVATYYYGPGFAVEIIAFVILGVGVMMKGGNARHVHGTKEHVLIKSPTPDSRD